MEAELGISMPGCKKKEGIKEVLLMLLMFLWKESFKDRDDTLWKIVNGHLSVNTFDTYLQDILKVSCCKLLQTRDIVGKLSDSVQTKCGNHSKTKVHYSEKGVS